MNDVLTISEAGRLLKVGRATINRYIRTGTLKAYKLNPGKRGAVRILRGDLHRFVKSNQMISGRISTTS